MLYKLVALKWLVYLTGGLPWRSYRQKSSSSYMFAAPNTDRDKPDMTIGRRVDWTRPCA